MWAPYTIWQAVLKGLLILRQKAYFGPDYWTSALFTRFSNWITHILIFIHILIFCELMFENCLANAISPQPWEVASDPDPAWHKGVTSPLQREKLAKRRQGYKIIKEHKWKNKEISYFFFLL